MKKEIQRIMGLRFLAAGVLAVAGLWLSGGSVSAAPVPLAIGTPQITINPGGGLLPDGSDGLRFTINGDEDIDDGGHEWNEIDEPGQDSPVYKGTKQYCCGAGGPMLSIGGQLYASDDVGPGDEGESLNWDAIELVSTSGAVVVGDYTSQTGSGSAVIRYTVVRNNLTYVLTRTIGYTYPNNFVTDSYSLTIPQGNTEQVKFYLGGDTAPGSDDEGYGIMYTQPVRSVISLNPDSQILFGIREVTGSKPFDGANSREYNDEYDNIRAGGDIGFYVEAGDSWHDAGLMVQWNFGSAPGTYSAALEQFVESQATSLSATFSTEQATPGAPVQLRIAANNTLLTAASGVGYTFTLPAGMTIAAGAQTNTCGGTLTAVAGGNTIVLAGADIAEADNCVVAVPVVAADGAYVISAASVSGLAGIVNNMGVSTLTIASTVTPEAGGDDAGVVVGVPNTGLSRRDMLASVVGLAGLGLFAFIALGVDRRKRARDDLNK